MQRHSLGIVMTILFTALAWPADSMRLYRTDPSDYLVDTAVLKQQLEVARSRLTRKTLQDSIDDGTIPVGFGQEGEEDGDENGLGLLEPLDEVPIQLTDADKAAMAAFNAYDGDDDEFQQEGPDGLADASEQEAFNSAGADALGTSSSDVGQQVGTKADAV